MKKCNTIREFQDYLDQRMPKFWYDAEGKKHGDKFYYDTIGAFNIETSTCKIEGTEGLASYVYFWSFSLDGELFIWGREPQEFVKFLKQLVLKKRLLIYCHDLTFVYWNLKNLFHKSMIGCSIFKDDVFDFNNGRHTELNMINLFDSSTVSPNNIGRLQFRCLKNLNERDSIDTLGKELGYKQIKFDRTKERNRHTVMTEEEIEYCVREVEIICKWALNFRESFNIKDVNTIPNNPSGICNIMLAQNEEYNSGKAYNMIKKKYKNWEKRDCKIFKEAFKGGVITSNKSLNKYYNSILYADIKSAYPAVMIGKKFPKQFGRDPFISEKIEQYRIENYEEFAAVAKFTFTNLRLKPHMPCSILKDDKGNEIYEAQEYSRYMTNLELDDIKRFYDFDSLVWEDLQLSAYEELDPLEVEIIEEIFIMKEEEEGMLRDIIKGQLNSIYGLYSTHFYDENSVWENGELVYQKTDKEEVAQRSRYYPVGVWISAWQRKNMVKIIAELGDDFIYCNTDGLLCHDTARSREIINNYNSSVVLPVSGWPFDELGKFQMQEIDKLFFAGSSKYVCKDKNGKVIKRVWDQLDPNIELTDQDLEDYANGGGFVKKNGLNTYYMYYDQDYYATVDGERVKIPNSYCRFKTIYKCSEVKEAASVRNIKYV